MSERKLNVRAEITPNPNALKFVVEQSLIESGSYDFNTLEKAKSSFLASRLFMIAGVEGVLIGTHFVSVNKTAEADWTKLVEPLVATIEDVLLSGDPLIDPDYIAENPQEAGANETEIERRIREILDTEIRPAIAMDGGDVVFQGYENGIVTLYLQGACSSCPSSTMTLKYGIENRLKEEFPEIRDVVQL